jgi:hypothetical protein
MRADAFHKFSLFFVLIRHGSKRATGGTGARFRPAPWPALAQDAGERRAGLGPKFGPNERQKGPSGTLQHPRKPWRECAEIRREPKLSVLVRTSGFVFQDRCLKPRGGPSVSCTSAVRRAASRCAAFQALIMRSNSKICALSIRKRVRLKWVLLAPNGQSGGAAAFPGSRSNDQLQVDCRRACARFSPQALYRPIRPAARAAAAESARRRRSAAGYGRFL